MKVLGSTEWRMTDTIVSPAKTAEPIEMPMACGLWWGQWNMY